MDGKPNDTIQTRYDNMLDKPNVHRALEEFSQAVIRQAQRNKPSSAAQSLDAEILTHKQSFSLLFEGAVHVPFLDQGVRGKDSSYKAPNSPYKFGTGNFSGTWGTFKTSLTKWVKNRGLRLRNKETGRFTKGGRKALVFLIQRSIYKTGLSPTYFFTEAVQQELQNLPPELEDAYALDTEGLIDHIFKNYKVK